MTGEEFYLLVCAICHLSELTRPSAAGSVRCPVNPNCSCSPHPNTDIFCDFSRESQIPPFAPSKISFRELVIIGGPYISSVEDGLFEGMSAKKLSLRKTSISSLGCEFFQGLDEKLEAVDLADNNINRMPTCALKGNNNIKWLSLRGNQITVLSNNAFTRMTKLEHLDLSDNGITTMTKETLRSLQQLQTLNVSGNQLQRQLPRDLFLNLQKLTVLDLSRNQIVDLPVTTCELKRLYLRDNRLQIIDSRSFICNSKGDSPGKHNLEMVDLSENRIWMLQNAVFLAGKEFNLKLEGNRLENTKSLSVTVNVTDVDVGATVRINISTNGLQQPPCITFNVPTTFNLTIHIDVSNNKLTNIQPLTIQSIRDGLRVERLSPENFRLFYTARHNLITQFPLCHTFQLNSFEKLDMGHNLMTILPEGNCAPATVYTLRIDNNKINTINRLTYGNSNRLAELDLQNNMIKIIPLDMLIGLENSLKEVNLANNHITATNLSVFDSLSSLNSLKLQDNPIYCNCKAPRSARMTNVIVLDNVRCMSPEDRRDFMLKCAWIICTGAPFSDYAALDSECEADQFIRIEVKAFPMGIYFNLTWDITGPGKLTDLKVRINSVPQNTNSLYIHLNTSDVFTILPDFAPQKIYNVCLLATVSNKIETVCVTNITVNSPDSGKTHLHVYGIIISLSVICFVLFLCCCCYIRKYNTLRRQSRNGVQSLLVQRLKERNEPTRKSTGYRRILSIILPGKGSKYKASSTSQNTQQIELDQTDGTAEELGSCVHQGDSSACLNREDTLPKEIAPTSAGEPIPNTRSLSQLANQGLYNTPYETVVPGISSQSARSRHEDHPQSKPDCNSRTTLSEYTQAQEQLIVDAPYYNKVQTTTKSRSKSSLESDLQDQFILIENISSKDSNDYTYE